MSRVHPLPGPRQAVSVPRTAVPPAATDAHAHVLGPYATYPLSPDRDYDPPEAPVAQYRSLVQTVGFERTVIVQPSVYGTDNRATLAAVQALGRDRSRAVVMIPTDTPTEEIARLDEAGAVGVRFLSLQNGSPALAGIEGLAERIAQFGWHIQCWMPPAEWSWRLETLTTLPVPIVFDHLAQLSPRSPGLNEEIDTLERVLETGTVWVKAIGYRLSAQPPDYRDVTPIIKRLAAHHPDRLLWGFDWPHTNVSTHVPDDGELVDAFADAIADPNLFRRILVDNPAALYGFGAADPTSMY